MEAHLLSVNPEIQLMRSLLLIVFLLFSYVISYSQNDGAVKGKLTDTALKQPMSSATVSIMKQVDSSFAGYVVSDKTGMFEIKNLNLGNYFILVSFMGYENYKMNFSLTKEKKIFDAGNITMKRKIKTLDGVTVSDATPIRINGDTVSFKVSAFNTRPDATVEDVLKKMPGMQVQKDGTVNAMGENVQKVYVNGKEFFGDDPKLATKNITADMVDQIQVYDDMSEQAKFTKIDDGSRSKTINIKLKKDRNSGDFGRVAAGGGTNNRYEGNLSYNRFRDDQKISVIASANNTNKQSYSFKDGSSTQFSQGGSSAGMASMGSGGGISNGVSAPKSVGVNYNDMWGNKVDFRTSYYFSNNDFFLNQDKFKKNSFPGDSSSAANIMSTTKNKNNNHRINARWEYRIDSANSVLYTANLSFQNTNIFYSDTSFTTSEATARYLAITATSGRTDMRDATNYSGELLYRRRFKVRGRTFTLGWRKGYAENEVDNLNFNPITTYNKNGAVVGFINYRQQNIQLGDNNNNTISASYTEPLGINQLLEINYSYSEAKNISDKKTYDYNPATAKYDLINLYQTNFFDYKNISHRIGTNYRLQKAKHIYQLGMGIQQAELETRSIKAGKDTLIRQQFVNFFPTANFNYNITRSKNIKLYYRGRTNAPTISQLQDVPDYTNPLQIRTGNASLKQEFNHTLNFGYNSFNQQSMHYFNANINFSTTTNRIVNTIDSSGTVALIMKPENLNGSFNTSGMFSFGIPFKKMPGSNLNISTMGYYSRDIGRIYGKNNFITLMMINQSVGFNFVKPKYELGIAGSFVYNKVDYDFQQLANIEYFNQSWAVDFNYRFENEFSLIADLDYFINSGRANGFNQNVFLWNIAVAKQVFKNNNGEIKITAYDILNQSKGINRTSNDNYIEDIRSNVVPRFFLLSFTYNLRQKTIRKSQPAQQTVKTTVF